MAPSSRRSAAESLLEKMGGAMGSPEEEDEFAPPPMDEGAPMPEGGEGLPPPPSEEGVDLEGALAGVEAAMEGLPEDVAKEVRTHLEAIRDITSGGSGMAEAPPEEGKDLPPAPDAMMPPEMGGGMEKLPV